MTRPHDRRFAHVHTDPRFRRPHREDTKVVLDDRFKDVLTGAGSKQIDRFGRAGRVNEAKSLQRLYRLDEGSAVDYARGEGELESSSEEESEDEEEEEEEEDDDDEEGDVVLGGADAVRRAKAADDSESDASIDLDEELDEDVMAELDHQATQQRRTHDDDVARGDDTCRLAVVNMDWDHVRAADLYKVFASIVMPTATREPLAPVPMTAKTSKKRASDVHLALTPVRGQVRSVRIYLSDFGRERLAQEDRQGPPTAIFKSSSKVKASSTTTYMDEGAEFDENALRKYQLERLRYYYAVATFDSAKSARHVYNEIDGTEMERSANMFDLRFVPDDMALPDGEDGRPAEFTDEATHDVAQYEGLDFKTDALRHSKVRLTWDQDDPRRTKLTRAKNLDALREDDLKTYLASSDEDEEEPDAGSKDRLRALVRDMPSKSAFDDADDDDSMFAKPEGEMQISFMPALSSKSQRSDATQEETTIEKYMRKQRERREKRKAKSAAPADAAASSEPITFDDPFFADERDLESVLAEETNATKKAKKAKKADGHVDTPTAAAAAAAANDDGEDDDEDAQHFNLQDIVRAEKMQTKKLSKHQRRREAKRAEKRAALVQPSFHMDTNDPRFAAVMEDHRFAIDPSHPSFVKTAGMQQLIDEGHRRRAAKADRLAADRSPDVASLVSSVKQKAQAPPAKKARR